MRKNIGIAGLFLLMLSSLLFLVAYITPDLRLICWPATGMGIASGILGIVLVLLKVLGIKNAVSSSSVKPDEFQILILNSSARLSFWISDLTLFIFVFLLNTYINELYVGLNTHVITIALYGYFILHNLIAVVIFLCFRQKFNK